MSDNDMAYERGVELEEALDALQDLVNNACTVAKEDGSKVEGLDSMGMSSYAEAMRILVKHGRIRILKDYGRRVIWEWVK